MTCGFALTATRGGSAKAMFSARRPQVMVGASRSGVHVLQCSYGPPHRASK